MRQKTKFTDETKSLIADLERKYRKEQKYNESRQISKHQLDFIDKLIKRYDEVFGEADENMYVEASIFGEEYYILPGMEREVKAVVNAVRANAFDNKPVYKRFVENGQVKRKKTYKPYRVKRLVLMLKVAKEANYGLFENFVKIPDVRYALRIIETNRFGELDVYMGVKGG